MAKVAEAGAAAKEKYDKCMEYIRTASSLGVWISISRTNGQAMRLTIETKYRPKEDGEGPDEPEKEKPSLLKLTQRTNVCKAKAETGLNTAQLAKERLRKLMEATTREEKARADVAKYDNDKDKVLNKKEVKAYAKG
eukprot:844901-Amphidinium_carterae.1